MISKGNELLQQLYKRLKFLWEKGEPFPLEERQELLTKIVKEYNDDTDFKGYDRADNKD